MCYLAHEEFPDMKHRNTFSQVATSVGLMNLTGCWFGAMPTCHGAGGLAGQVKFGGKTGWAPIYLGVLKLAVGLLAGSSLFSIL